MKTYIVNAKRSPIGKKDRSLSTVPVKEIAKQTIQGFSNLDLTEVDSLLMGTVLQTGLGSNVARQVALSVGMKEFSTAQTVNMVCGSGLFAVHLAANKIRLKEANLVLAGGAENMSGAPSYGVNQKPTLLQDALLDPFDKEHMGMTAENVANKYRISRTEQDQFALLSQQKAKKRGNRATLKMR